MNQFEGISEFVLTVDLGSFAAAGSHLGMTGSAIGKIISRLETRLGIQLLHRTTRRLNLTTEGEAYLITCRRILEELNHTEAYLSTGHHQPVGRLRVDLPSTFGRRHILPSLINLSLKHTGLDLSVSFRDRAVDMVSEGVDIAVRIGVLKDYPDLIARRLGEQRLILCAAPQYLERKGIPIKPLDLEKHDCLVGWSSGNHPTWLLMNAQGRIERQEITFRHELIDGDALIEACVAGCGVAQLPTWIAGDALKDGSLVQVLEGMAGGTMPIHVVWQKTWHSQPKVRLAIDELVQLSLTKPQIFSL